jgi:hypothetical protein
MGRNDLSDAALQANQTEFAGGDAGAASRAIVGVYANTALGRRRDGVIEASLQTVGGAGRALGCAGERLGADHKRRIVLFSRAAHHRETAKTPIVY